MRNLLYAVGNTVQVPGIQLAVVADPRKIGPSLLPA